MPYIYHIHVFKHLKKWKGLRFYLQSTIAKLSDKPWNILAKETVSDLRGPRVEYCHLIWLITERYNGNRKWMLNLRLSRTVKLCPIGINRFNCNPSGLIQLMFLKRTLSQPFSVEMQYILEIELAWATVTQNSHTTQSHMFQLGLRMVEKVDHPNQL